MTEVLERPPSLPPACARWQNRDEDMQAMLAERRGEVKRMTEEGITAERIADALRITVRTVQRDRAETRVTRQRIASLSAEEMDAVHLLLEDDCPLAEIARTVGRPKKFLLGVLAQELASRPRRPGGRILGKHHQAMAEQLGLLVL